MESRGFTGLDARTSVSTSYLAKAGEILQHFDEESLQAIADLTVPALADWCFIHLLRDDGTVALAAVAHRDAAAVAHVRAAPLAVATPIGRVLAGGAPELVAIDEATPYRCMIVAPLEGRGRVLGAMAFAMAESDRRFVDADLALLVDLARRSGAAFDTARMLARAEQARDRTRRLQELTARLVAAVDERDVLAALVDVGRLGLGAEAGYAWRLVGDHVELVTLARPDRDPPIGRYHRIAMAEDLPVTRAIAANEPVLVSSRGELLATYPTGVPLTPSHQAWAVMPIAIGGRAIGAVQFSFTSERPFTADDRELLAAMSGQAAIALERARLYGDLRAGEERLRSALTAARAATWRVDLATMTVARDGAYADVVESSGESPLDFEAVHPDDREVVRAAFARTVRDDVPYAPELRARRRDGGYVWVRVQGQLVRDAAGTPIAVAGVILDIDEAKRERLRADDERHLNDTLHRLGRAFASELDLDRLLARIPAEIGAEIGATRSELVAGEAPAGALSARVAAASGESFGTLAFRGVFTPQHERLVASMAPYAAAALENARLYRSLREHKEQLEAAVDRAAAADRRKDEFLAMLGHELRNPLAPIATALQLADLRGVPHLQRERAVIRRQVDHLTRLIDDLLDVSRITRGMVQLSRREVDLAGIVAKAIEMASPMLERQRQHLAIDVPVGIMVDADPERLAQVFHNLLTNASKYSPPESEIAVSATRGRARVVIEVTDRGSGIAPELLPHVFDLFVQGERTIDRSQGGLGLGLAIARNLVELHDGAIEAISAGLGYGSTFAVTLPIAAAAKAPTVEMPPLAKPPSRGVRVLVVDDNTDAAQLLEMFLAELGYEAAVAYDGVSALELAARFQPHVAVLDIGLPVMDGYELARRLRSTLPGSPPRLIAVTGYGQEGDRQRAQAAGFDHHMVKPIALDALVPLLTASTTPSP